MKAKLSLLEAKPSTSQTSKTFQPKNKGLVVETFDWNEEEVSDNEEVTHVKVNTLLSMDKDADWQNYFKYININLNFVEEQRLNLLSRQLKNKKKINEKWLTSSKKVSQCINEAIPHQKKKVLGGELFIESSSKMNENENIFVPASMGILYCMICKREDHRTSDHEMYTALLRRSKNYKAWPYQYASPSKQQLKAKAKLFPPCTHCGFNEHKLDDCINYPECGIFESYDHFTSGHNRVIHIRGGVLAESAQSSESSIGVKCNTRGSTVLSTTNHNEFDHFKSGEKIQATKDKEPTKKWVHKRNKPKFIIYVETNQGAYLYLDSGFLMSMTGVMIYLHKYVEQTGPKVVFGDNSSYITEGYDSINYGGSTIKLHSKLNKTSLSGSVCISFIWIYLDQKKSQALEMIMSFIRIVENQNDVKVKQIRTDNGTNFRNYELESFYDEKGISQNFTSPYTLKQNGIAERKNRTVIEAARTMLNGSDHLGKFNAKDDDGYFLGYSFVSKAFRVFNAKRKEVGEIFNEGMEAIRFTNTSNDEIGIDDSSRYPPDEFLYENDPSRQYQVDFDVLYYVFPHGHSLTKLTQDNHVPDVIAPNEPDIPLTEDNEDPLDLINTEGTHKQNV
nr:retrovirus-related Pol polyprotein from transposon TNT 1-94 [Tanacetum cinerariifolium]